MKPLILIFLLFTFPFFSLAENNDKEKTSVKNISGKIASSGGEDLAAVKITIKETNETFFADLSGNFKLQLKNDKVYTISVESIGYAPLEVSSTELTLFSEIHLKEL